MADDILRYAELVEESVFAVEPPPAAGNAESIYIDISSTTLDVPNETDGIVESAFGRSARKKFAGWYMPSGNLVHVTNIRTIAYLFKWALGGYAFTQGAAAVVGPPAVPAQPNVHEAWGSDDRTIKSFLARIGKDKFEHMFRGCTVSSVELAVEADLVRLTVEVVTQVDKKQPLQLKSTVFAKLPKEKEIPFHAVNASIAGVVQAKKMKNLTLSVANNADAEAGRYLGSRYAGRITVNERVVTVSTDMDFTDLAQIERLWGGTEGPTDSGATEFPMELDFFGGLNADGVEQRLLVKLPRVFYTSVETQPSGREQTSQPVAIRSLTDNVTLNDGVTVVSTDIYTRVKNYAPIVKAAA